MRILITWPSCFGTKLLLVEASNLTAWLKLAFASVIKPSNNNISFQFSYKQIKIDGEGEMNYRVESAVLFEAFF